MSGVKQSITHLKRELVWQQGGGEKICDTKIGYCPYDASLLRRQAMKKKKLNKELLCSWAFAFLLLKFNLYAKLHCCFNLNADQTSLAEAIQHSESLPVFGKGQKLLCLGLFWQPAAHCCHALFEIEKKVKVHMGARNASERGGK